MKTAALVSISSGPRVRARTRQGRCFELAAKGLMRDPSWTLIHGVTHGLIAHAWLLKEGTVYDAVLDQHVSAREYEETHGAVIERQYKLKEAAEFMASTGCFGPWHKTSGIVNGVVHRKERTE